MFNINEIFLSSRVCDLFSIQRKRFPFLGASFPIQKKIHIRAFSWHWFIYKLQKAPTNIQPEVDLGTNIAKPAFCENQRREVRIRSSLSVSQLECPKGMTDKVNRPKEPPNKSFDPEVPKASSHRIFWFMFKHWFCLATTCLRTSQTGRCQIVQLNFTIVFQLEAFTSSQILFEIIIT